MAAHAVRADEARVPRVAAAMVAAAAAAAAGAVAVAAAMAVAAAVGVALAVAAPALAAISAFKDRSGRAISALKRVAEARRSGAECQWTMAVAQRAR
jgi:hypothetical protein